jgi:hypothetical protein
MPVCCRFTVDANSAMAGMPLFTSVHPDSGRRRNRVSRFGLPVSTLKLDCPAHSLASAAEGNAYELALHILLDLHRFSAGVSFHLLHCEALGAIDPGRVEIVAHGL